jgi:hypothetical protein
MSLSIRNLTAERAGREDRRERHYEAEVSSSWRTFAAIHLFSKARVSSCSRPFEASALRRLPPDG